VLSETKTLHFPLKIVLGPTNLKSDVSIFDVMSCFKEIVSELFDSIKNYDVTSSLFFEILFFEIIDFTFPS
jgi:ABC-type arginine/histidine transport system permease subunit